MQQQANFRNYIQTFSQISNLLTHNDVFDDEKFRQKLLAALIGYLKGFGNAKYDGFGIYKLINFNLQQSYFLMTTIVFSHDRIRVFVHELSFSRLKRSCHK